MSLRVALLGLLAEQPASGYDLTRRFEEGIGSFAWSAKHSQIYPELSRLTAEGLTQVVEEGGRGRKVYAVTTPGREALRQWLLGAHGDGGTVRNEFVLRLFLLSALGPADRLRVLEGVAAYAEEQVELLEAERVANGWTGRPGAGGNELAAAYGIRSYHAALDWAVWAASLARQEQSDPG